MNRVTQYALDVLEGREIAGKYVKLACQRHLDDLEKVSWRRSSIILMRKRQIGYLSMLKL